MIKLLHPDSPKFLEALFKELLEKAIFMAAISEPGRRYNDPVRQFYAGPPIEVEYAAGGYDSPDVACQIVTVNINSQEVRGSREAIRNMAGQECMQKHIAHQIREHSDRVARALFMGGMPPMPCSLRTDKDE